MCFRLWVFNQPLMPGLMKLPKLAFFKFGEDSTPVVKIWFVYPVSKLLSRAWLYFFGITNNFSSSFLPTSSSICSRRLVQNKTVGDFVDYMDYWATHVALSARVSLCRACLHKTLDWACVEIVSIHRGVVAELCSRLSVLVAQANTFFGGDFAFCTATSACSTALD